MQLGGPTEVKISKEVELLSMRLKSSGAVCHVQRRSAEHTQGYGMQKVGAYGFIKECDQQDEGLYEASVKYPTSRSIL